VKGLEPNMKESARTTRQPATPRRVGRPWRRHAIALAGTLAANAVLVMLLSSWAGADSPDRPRPPRVVRLEVADPVDPTEPPTEPPADRPAGRVEERPPAPAARPDLPTPPLPEPAAPSLSLELPPLPAIGSGLPPLPADVPAFLAAPAVSAPPVRPPIQQGSTADDPAGPSEPSGPSRGPVLLRPPNPAEFYPRAARIRGVTGATVVRVSVSRDGRVVETAVVRSRPPGVFEEAARRLARSLTYRPALRDGRPVRAAHRVELVWRLED
jgi:protein TonB